MATVFGISGFRFKLDDWRGIRKRTDASPRFNAEPPMRICDKPVVEDEADDLSRLLENLVIPKLIASRGSGDGWIEPASLSHADDSAGERPITSADVNEFTRLSLTGEAHVLLDFVDHCLATGSSVETVYVDLLAPAARRLGEFWENDSEDFVGVTMGLWRIQEILRELTLRIPPKSRSGHWQRSALFTPMPGEQHSFGTLMVAECFQRAGWDTDVLIEPSQSELNGKLAKRHYDLIGLTVSCDCSTATLGNMVNTIKTVSCNSHVRVMVGGRVINENPDLVGECGADGTAVDAPSAVALADQMVPLNIDCFENLS